MMKEASPRTIYLKDYTPPPYEIESLDLVFRLFEEGAEVVSTMKLRRLSAESESALCLDGEDLELKSLLLDGRELEAGEYVLSDESLTIASVPEQFELTTGH